MKKAPSCFVIFLILFSTCSFAQENASGIDVLKWYPNGSYEFLARVDIDSIMQSDLREISGNLLDRFMSELEIFETDTLERGCVALNLAIAKDIALKKRKKRKKKEEDSGWSFPFYTGNFMYVFEYSSLDQLIKELLEKEMLDETGFQIAKRPIYKTNISGESETFFAYATEDQMLLLCEKKDLLTGMINSGLGKRRSILDNAELDMLVEVIPDSQAWAVQFADDLFDDNNADDENESEEKENDLHQPGYSVQAYTFSDRIIFNETLYFSDDNQASAYKSEIDRMGPEYVFDTPFPDKSELNQEVILEGKRIRVNVVFDTEIIAEKYRKEDELKKEKVQESGRKDDGKKR